MKFLHLVFPNLLRNKRRSALTFLAVALSICAVALLLLNWGMELSRDADKIAQIFGPNGNQSFFSY